MPVSFPVSPDPAGARSDRSDPWAELRRYEQAKADGTAPEASFGDLLDVINPLQHIPIVSTIYRELTGDTIQGAARIVGGGLYGGIGGFVGGLVNAFTEEATGEDLAGHAMVAAGLREATPDDATTPADTVQVAKAEGAATPAPQADAAGAPTAAPAQAQTSAQPTAQPTTETGAQTTAQAALAAAEPRPAGEDAALAVSGGALTGLAALRAFARDTGQAAAAAQADRTAAARTQVPNPAHLSPAHENPAVENLAAERGATARGAGELQANQQANAALDRTASPAAAAASAPTQFMALGDRGALINHRVRTNPAALAAESDRIGHRRLQGDPRMVPTPATASRAPASAPAAEPTAAPAATAPQPAGTVQGMAPGAAAARGDLAERMMRALNKYEAMHRNQ
jgi:hypothetical protein